MMGLAGSIRLSSFSFGSPMNSFMNSGSGRRTRLDGMGGEEAVLNVEERGRRGLGGAAADEAEIAGLLGVAGEDHAPAAVGDGHHVVVAGMDVQSLAGERPAPIFMTTGNRLPAMV